MHDLSDGSTSLSLVYLTPQKGLCLTNSTALVKVLKKLKENVFIVYAAAPPDGYENLITTLGFTGIPLLDLQADIRIANLLVSPGRAG